jgi:uncharacterized protein (TIGR02145 family)
LDGGRLRLSIGDYDINGRPLSSVSGSSSTSMSTSAARASSSNTLDTVIYSWNGTVILRDTIGVDSLAQTGILRFFDTSINASVTYGYVNDAQGHLYRTTTIGSQVWMAQNLNYKVDSSWCYSNSADSCAKYGRLYQWAAVMGLDASYNSKLWSGTLPRQGICPSGWHVPSDSEWSTLTTYIGGDSSAGTKLKSTGGWYNSGNGTDTYGFRGLPAGIRLNDSSFAIVGNNAYFWSASEYVASLAWSRYLSYGNASLGRYDGYEANGFSLRCLED